jgi:DNA-3-methyladenine glycosylase II
MATEIKLPYDHVAAHAHLSAKDKRLAKLILKNGEFKFALETCDSVYESLLESIAFQSISGKAATKIFSRIRALGANGVCPTPEEILATPVRTLREAGLSNAKAAAMHDLAQKTIDGVVPTLEAAHALSDQELVERLSSVRGIGAWTVEMFLMFRLGRPDVLPIHDYGVQKGFALTYGTEFIPKPRELAEFGERWRPYRSLASWYMWRAVEHYGHKRKVTKAPVKKRRKTQQAAKSKSSRRKARAKRKSK